MSKKPKYMTPKEYAEMYLEITQLRSAYEVLLVENKKLKAQIKEK